VEFLNLLPNGPESFFVKVEQMPAKCATVITRTQDFGKLFQRKAQLQSSLCKLHSLDGRCRENPVTAIRAPMNGMRTQPSPQLFEKSTCESPSRVTQGTVSFEAVLEFSGGSAIVDGVENKSPNRFRADHPNRNRRRFGQ
jgi:hypothetical protein